jgi:hypothetical protein
VIPGDGVHTIGHGQGLSERELAAFDHDRRVPRGEHLWTTPVLSETSGGPSRETVKRAVGKNLEEFNGCYEAALALHRGAADTEVDGLEGRVVVVFSIDRNGAVSTASSVGSDVTDQGLVACVVRRFAALTFPPSRRGVAAVVYPVVFHQGEAQLAFPGAP